MANGYGTYDPTAPDPVLEARKALFRQRAMEDAAGTAGLDQMNDRAGIRYDTGVGPRALPGVDIALPPIGREAGRLSTNQPQPAPAIARAAAPVQRPPTPQPQPSAPSSRVGRAAEGLTAARNLASSYSTPEWNGVGGGIPSAAQMEQDFRAHELIDRGYRQGVDQNAVEEAVRGNPMERAIEARKKLLGYEDLLPETATSRVRFGYGSADRNLMDYGDQQAPPLGAPTMGEARAERSAIAQAAARQNPKDVAEAALGMGRGRLAEELDLLRRQLDEDVRAGRRRPEEARAEWAKAADEVKTLAETLKTGYPPADLFGGTGVPGAPPAPISGR